MKAERNPATVIDVEAMVERDDDAGLSLAIAKQEIDLQIATAKNYPRSLAQFQKSCMEMVTYSREAAEKMFYKLPRKKKDGSTTLIEGPSVRLAEIIGQNWRNCRIGARVLGHDDKTVTSQGVFHDLETNVAISFEIRRRITKKDGTRYDEDMITVTGAAAAGIAFRNAVLKGVPKMFWQPMYEKALLSARVDENDNIAPRRKAALEEFAKMGVPEAALLETLGVTGTSKIGPDQLLTLRGIYNAIKEGTTTAQEAFELEPKPIARTMPANEEDLTEQLKQSVKEAQAAKRGGKPGREKKKPPKSEPAKSEPLSKPPKANIPPINDPFLDTQQQTAVFHKAAQAGWRIPEEINVMLQKVFKVKSLREVRNSQFAAVLAKVESGS